MSLLEVVSLLLSNRVSLKIHFWLGLIMRQVQVTDATTTDKYEKSSKDTGSDPMHEPLQTPSNWPLEFERQQRAILELWQTCNVSLVHRTYFFLLFQGDPTDSIYMEVELRRLSFLKETFSQGNQGVGGGRTPTLSSRYSLFPLPFLKRVTYLDF